MKRLFTLAVLMTMFVTHPVFAQQVAQPEEQPIFTFACLSDLHSQQTLISGSVESVRLRGTIQKTLDSIKNEENLDLIVLGGDYLSDVTISYENYLRTRELLVEATRNTFPEGAKTPVIYMNGNHEYEVANFDNVPKGYNAGDYYDIPMKTDIGTLADEDCFYEMASNGSSDPVKLLAAYHYVIKGFDFVVLNTGKHFFQNAWNYTYSEESIEWIGNKLAEINAENPNKTVFFLVHIPFGDSNSISSASKGMTEASAELLKPILSKYPNLIMLYGHDHGKDTAYIRENTAQRVTQYDSNGNKWVAPVEEEEEENVSYSIQNYSTGKFLGFNSYNMANTDEASSTATVTALDNGAFNIHLSNFIADLNNPYVYCGSSGRFSGNSDPANASSKIMVFEVADPAAETVTAAKVSQITAGKTYLLVGTKSSKYYALTNEMYKENDADGGQRMVGLEVTIADDKVTYTPTGEYSALWTFNKLETDTEEPGEEEEIAPALCNIQNYNTGKYLGFNSYNLANTSSASSDVTVTASTVTKGSFNFHMTGFNSAYSGPYLYCGSSGRFSGNKEITNASSQIMAFEVEEPAAETITAAKASKITAGKTYLLVGLKNGSHYALTNEMYKENDAEGQRMVGLPVSITDDKITYTPSGDYSALWTINEQIIEPVEPGTPSFFSAFVGSMRYYSNSIDGGSSVNDSRIIQAMMVYVYADRVELKMKNYGESGTINGITINKDLTPYVSYRTVEHSAEAVTVAPAFASDVVGGEVKLGDPISLRIDVPEWHNVYYTTDGSTPTEESNKVVGGTIQWVPDSEGEYVVKIAAQEGIRLLSPSVESAKYIVKKAEDVSISTPEATTEATIYTITGRAIRGSIKALEKGIYIVNGKKMIVR